MTSYALGEMHVIGEPPPKLVRALAVVSEHLHPTYDEMPGITAPGHSKRSCVFCSLVIRDFLKAIGFRRARLTTCYFIVRCHDADGTERHSVAVGDHNRMPRQLIHQGPVNDTDTHWSGHAVCEVDGWVIDATLYQAQRPAFGDMPGMVAIDVSDDTAPFIGLTPLAGAQSKANDGSVLSMLWLRQSNDRWKDVPDVTTRRVADTVAVLVKQWRKG